ncbi:hypothetical protein [Paenibacillus alvei]|uniref:hypothetical protein n=1 Tax=Paenibacillus alvei TaxID=44250 RepID=UPI003D3023E6
MLRKGGDVPGKEVSSANGRLTSLLFEAGSFALPAIELRFAAQPYKSRVTFCESPLR